MESLGSMSPAHQPSASLPSRDQFMTGGSIRARSGRTWPSTPAWAVRATAPCLPFWLRRTKEAVGGRSRNHRGGAEASLASSATERANGAWQPSSRPFGCRCPHPTQDVVGNRPRSGSVIYRSIMSGGLSDNHVGVAEEPTPTLTNCDFGVGLPLPIPLSHIAVQWRDRERDVEV